MGYSTTFYRNNKKSRKKKQAYDAKLNASAAMIKKRSESNKKVAEYEKRNGHKPSSKGLQYDHAVDRFVKASVNQGRRGEGNR